MGEGKEKQWKKLIFIILMTSLQTIFRGLNISRRIWKINPDKFVYMLCCLFVCLFDSLAEWNCNSLKHKILNSWNSSISIELVFIISLEWKMILVSNWFLIPVEYIDSKIRILNPLQHWPYLIVLSHIIYCIPLYCALEPWDVVYLLSKVSLKVCYHKT